MKPDGAFILALGRAKDKHDSMHKEDDGKGMDEDKHSSDKHDMAKSAMDDLISALHSKDSAKALDAFSDLCDMHREDYGPEEDE